MNDKLFIDFLTKSSKNICSTNSTGPSFNYMKNPTYCDKKLEVIIPAPCIYNIYYAI